MDRLQSMRMFVRVVELRSFSAAARELNVGQPTVSKVVAALEASVFAKLIERTTTRLTVTDVGERFYARCKAVLEEYDEAIADVRGQTRELAGLLRVSAPIGLGELHLNDLVMAFLAQFPNIEIELLLNDRMIDLVEEGVDVALRLGDTLPPDAFARHVTDSPRVLVAAEKYVRAAPPLHKPEDLRDHEYVRFAGLREGNTLIFNDGKTQMNVATRGRYSINSSLALRRCFVQGFGLGSAPAWVVQDLIDTGDLMQLLPEWRLPSQAVHLIYPSRRYQPRRTKAFLDFMIEQLPQRPGFALQPSD